MQLAGETSFVDGNSPFDVATGASCDEDLLEPVPSRRGSVVTDSGRTVENRILQLSLRTLLLLSLPFTSLLRIEARAHPTPRTPTLPLTPFALALTSPLVVVVPGVASSASLNGRASTE
jgi:hypothetical protein